MTRRRGRRAMYEVAGGRRTRETSLAVRTRGGGVFAAVDRFFYKLGWANKRNRRRTRRVRRH